MVIFHGYVSLPEGKPHDKPCRTPSEACIYHLHRGFRRPSKVFCIDEVWLFFMTCMHLVWSFIHDWDRYCMFFIRLLPVFWWFLSCLKRFWLVISLLIPFGSITPAAFPIFPRLTELDFQWREKDIGENTSEIPDENGCGMGMIWYDRWADRDGKWWLYSCW